MKPVLTLGEEEPDFNEALGAGTCDGDDVGRGPGGARNGGRGLRVADEGRVDIHANPVVSEPRHANDSLDC